MPGPDNILVVTESIAKGAKNGILLAFGMNLGIVLHTLAAATGISLILQQSELAFTIVQYLGAAYLIYLAYQTFREEVALFERKKTDEKGSFKIFKTGLIMNVLNPKVSLFFIAFLPQFVVPESGQVAKQMILLGVIFMVIGFITFSSFALLAHQLRKPLNSLRVLRIIKGAKVVVLLGMALLLLIT